jgi:hypothetical protein
LAKTAIFARLCDGQVRGVVGKLGRNFHLGREKIGHFSKGRQLSDEVAVRLRMYVRNILYSNLDVMSEDVAGRRQTCIQVAQSQLGEDIADATGIELEALKAQRGNEVHLLFLLTKQLLEQRFICEKGVEVVAETLSDLCRSFEASDSLQQDGSKPPANAGKNYKDFLLVEKEKLLDVLAVEVNTFRADIRRIQEIIETVRLGTSEFIECVHKGRAFQLPTQSAVESSDRISESSEEEFEFERKRSAKINQDVRFWLQLNGFLRYEDCFAQTSWNALKTLTNSELAALGVGSNDASRLKLVQALFKIDLTDWSNVMFAGWMKKRGEGKAAAWRRRFFVLLSNKELLYFKSDAATKPQGSFFLSNVNSIQQKDGRFVSLETKGGRVYELDIDSETHSRWMSFFKTFKG